MNFNFTKEKGIKVLGLVFLALILNVWCTPAFAQTERTLNGTVLDNTGQPLPGVNITIKGTTQGTITDSNGKFSFSIPQEGATILFSFIGFKPREEQVSTQTSLDVSMEADVTELQDVVIVGYGQQDKRALTSSVAQVKNENIKNLKVPTFENLLVGQVAGVQVSTVTGHPGAGIYIRVRGTGSISSRNEPLYVIDGYPIESLPYNNQANLLSFLNPGDIESITILKDASAGSIYGSRASNGVVLITTKKAKIDKTEVEVNAMYGFQRIPQRGRYDVMNAEEFANFRRESLEDDMRRTGYLGADDILQSIDDQRVHDYAGANYDGVKATYEPYFGVTGPGTDWFDVMYNENAPVQQYNATVKSGTAKSRLLVSADYYTVDGVIKVTSYERASIRINADTEIGKRLKVGVRINPTYNVRQLGGATEGFPSGSSIGIMVGASPITPLYQEDGVTPTFAIGESPENFFYPNPLNRIRYQTDNRVDFRTLASANVEIKILDDLIFKTNIGTDLNFSRRRSVYPRPKIGVLGIFNPNANINLDPQSMDAVAAMEQISNWLIENTLVYNKTIRDHSFDVIVGHSAQKQTSYTLSGGAGRFPDDKANLNLSRAIGLYNDVVQIGVSEAFDSFKYALESYFGRINYSYKQRYDLSLSARSDGSSRYSKQARWGTFSAASVGWNIAQEPFFQNAGIAAISDLKIRASYGTTGNNATGGSFDYVTGLNDANYTFGETRLNGRYIGFADEGLRWEKSKTMDAGLDVSLFKNRLNVVLDYYNRETTDLILARPIPSLTGFTSTVTNIGSLQNRGIEISLDGMVIDRHEIQWQSNFNISFNRNKVLSLTDNGDPIIVGSPFEGRTISRIGDPIGIYYGYLENGVYRNEEEAKSSGIAGATAGSLKIVDVNGDKQITASDATAIGNPHPDFIFGFTNNVSYKGFDLSVQINGSFGNDVYISSYEFLRNMDGPFNVLKDVANRWRSPENPGNGIYPTTNNPTNQRQYSRLGNSNWVVDGSYFRVNNITLGYSVPVKNIGFLKSFSSVRLYTSVQNALIVSKSELNNPDASGGDALFIGYQRGGYPTARVISFGTNIKF